MLKKRGCGTELFQEVMAQTHMARIWKIWPIYIYLFLSIFSIHSQLKPRATIN